jgi:pseudouridine-5'-phosphate glycosidase
VAVVTSGVKSILDVESTREVLETLGVPVIGYQTSSFPAFYLRTSRAEVDARFDDPEQLASFVQRELKRTGRGIVIANPVPFEHEVDASAWELWLDLATRAVASETRLGRSATPLLLSKLHEVSGGCTLRTNIELAKSNAALAGILANRLAMISNF